MNMKSKREQSEPWLAEVIQQVKSMCEEAQNHQEVYEVPSEKTIQYAIDLLTEFQNAEKPQAALTQDGELVLTWTHFGDSFKAVVNCDGRATLFQNKRKVTHDSFAHRLIQVPA
jgi:hypothetical protein